VRLKSSTFLWVFLATAVPICIATLYATIYSERLYREDADREIAGSLNNIASEIRRRLLLDRDLLASLSEVPPVREFLPILEQLNDGRRHPEFDSRLPRLDRFLDDIQTIVSPTSGFRLLDSTGTI